MTTSNNPASTSATHVADGSWSAVDDVRNSAAVAEVGDLVDDSAASVEMAS